MSKLILVLLCHVTFGMGQCLWPWKKFSEIVVMLCSKFASSKALTVLTR